MPDRLPGLLLTGGASRRLGVDKATLVVRGERLADRAARALRAVCAPVLEVGPGATDLPRASEEPPGGGPLAALVAGASALATDGPLLLLACDLPFVEPPLLGLLASWPGGATVVPTAKQQPQVTCARYGIDALAAAPRLLAAGERSLRALLAAVGPASLPEPAWRAIAPAHAFADVDTPADVARAERLARSAAHPPPRH